jgi:polysaccharide biosynthesis/export protein
MKGRCFELLGLIVLLGSSCLSQQPSSGLTAGNSSSTSPPADSPVVFSVRNARYQLCAGDVMDLNFEFTPEFNQSNVAIQSDGFATLAGIGDVHLAGLTVPEARKQLVDSYSKILTNPVITLTLRDFNKPYFIAEGEVGKPGKYEMRARITLIEAIGMAGGFNDSSKHSEVWVFHHLADGTVQSKRVNVKQMLAQGDLKEDFSLSPGDTVYVPQNTTSKIKGLIQPSVGATMTPVHP